MRVVGLVLAAGASRRFGDANKLLAPIAGRPLLSWTLEAIASTKLARTYVVHDRACPQIATSAAQHRCVAIENPDPEAGLGRSIAIGVSHIDQADAVMVVLGDMPLSVAAADPVLAAWQAEPCDVLAPVYGGQRGHPVIFAAACFEELRALTGDFGASLVITHHRNQSRMLEWDDDRIHLDVDTPRDLARLAQRLSRL